MAENEVKEYSYELQKLFLEFLISSRDLAARCNNVLDPEYFDRRLRPAAKFIKEYITEHSNVPDAKQLSAVTTVEMQEIGDKAEEHKDWFLDEFEGFSRHKALEGAILNSADLLEKSNYGEVENLIKTAVQVGLPKTFGTDYFENPKSRLEGLKDANGQLTTGWTTVDNKLYGGFNKGELNIFAGASGAGKSLFLQNLGLNWAKAGLNTVYFSLELSEGLCSMRMDAMLTGTSTRDVYKKIDDIDLKVRMIGKKAGCLQIVQLPNSVTANDLLAWIREFQTQKKIHVDAILVDYLDLMMPAGQKISVADLYIKDKIVSEELRNLAVTENLLFATASQLNRSAVESVEFDHSMIAGGLSKIQTADNVFGIYSTPSMRERNRVQLQFMKTRSSSAVGQKLEMDFDPTTLLISDLADDAEPVASSATTVFNKLHKTSSTIVTPTEQPQSTSSSVNRDKLRGLGLTRDV